jgi:hypothetical protein
VPAPIRASSEPGKVGNPGKIWNGRASLGRAAGTRRRHLCYRLPADDADIVTRDMAPVAPFQLQVQMFTWFNILPLFPSDSKLSRLSVCHDALP